MEAGKYYHIYNRGNNKENIFKENKNYEFFLNQYDKYLTSNVNTYCYCLMSNHFHMFIQIKDEAESEEVIKAFKNFFISYAKAINKSYNRTGSLFQSKFKKKQIDNDYYFSMIVAYIHLNPVRAQIVKYPQDWNHSSYTSLLSEKPTKLSRKEVIDWFGNQEAFIQFHQSFLEESKARQILF
ncbi:transposase [Ekhidna sp.]